MEVMAGIAREPATSNSISFQGRFLSSRVLDLFAQFILDISTRLPDGRLQPKMSETEGLFFSHEPASPVASPSI